MKFQKKHFENAKCSTKFQIYLNFLFGAARMAFSGCPFHFFTFLAARIMLRRSGFRGFQLGFKTCKQFVNLVDLVKSFQRSRVKFSFFSLFQCPFFSIFFSKQIAIQKSTSICLRKSASIQPRTGRSKFAKN